MIFNKRMVKTLQKNNQKVMAALNTTFQIRVCTWSDQKKIRTGLAGYFGQFLLQLLTNIKKTAEKHNRTDASIFKQ